MGKVDIMSIGCNERVMKRVAILLSAALSISPAVAVPALAEEASTTGSVPVASANAAEGDQNQDSSTSKTDDVASDPKEDAVATVTTTGETKPFSTLEDAVKAVNDSGGTLTLCRSMIDDVYKITIEHADVTVTAEEGVVFRGTISIGTKATGCTVKDITFTNPGGNEKDECFSNCIEIHATGATVEKCTFDVPSGVWPVKDDKDDKKIYWQPNCVRVQANNCFITGNTFNLGRINEENAEGKIVDSDSNVAINLVGPNVSGVEISYNRMKVGKPVGGATDDGGSCFIVAIGNEKNENAYGISDVKVLRNTFYGTGDPKNARFAGFSNANELVIKGNTVRSAYSGVYKVTYWGESDPSVIETMCDNDIDATNNSLVKASVDSGGHTYCFSSVSDALESDYSNSGTVKLTQDTAENLTIPVSKKVTIDLAGHTLKEGVTITNNGNLAIADSVGTGVVNGTVTTAEGASLHITGGSFDSSKLTGDGSVVVSGGTFTGDTAPDIEVAPGYMLTQVDGKWVVVKKPAPSVPTYDVAVKQAEGGKVAVTPSSAKKGDDVTITAIPDKGQEVRSVTVTTKDGKKVKVTKGDKANTWTFEMPGGDVTVSVTFGCDGGELCPTHGFDDVDADAWYHDAVDWAVEEGLLSGYADGTLGPDGTLSRAQLATVLWRQAGEPEAKNDASFADCDPEAFYAEAVAWADEAGIIEGYGDGTNFGPEDPVTREQLATILWRQAGEPEGKGDLGKYPDGDEATDYAVPALEWAVEEGVLSGFGDGTLAPGGVLSRAMLAAMLQRMGE